MSLIIPVPVMSGGTVVRAALIDSRTGDILWINVVGSGAGKDLREPASAREMVGQLFKDFPAPMATNRKNKTPVRIATLLCVVLLGFIAFATSPG